MTRRAPHIPAVVLALVVLAVCVVTPGARAARPAQDEVAAPAPAAASASADQVTVEYPQGPQWLGSWFDLVVRGPDVQTLRLDTEQHPDDVLTGPMDRVDLADGRVEIRRPVCIARAGEYSLQLAVVTAAGETLTLEPVRLQVVLDLPDGSRAQVSDLLQAVLIPKPPAPIWPFLGPILAGLLLLGWLVVRDGREVPVFVYVPPADRVAMDALAALRSALPRTREEIRPFVIRVSDVLRVYIESMFQLHAPALTTEEFLSQVTQGHDALSTRREHLAGFLQRCDLVKYAGDRPAPATAEPLLETVEDFVEQTRAAEEEGVPS